MNPILPDEENQSSLKDAKILSILVKPGLFWCEQVCVPVHRWRLGMISNRASFAAHSCVRLKQFL